MNETESVRAWVGVCVQKELEVRYSAGNEIRE